MAKSKRRSTKKCPKNKVAVKGYTREDGTKVHALCRLRPLSSKRHVKRRRSSRRSSDKHQVKCFALFVKDNYADVKRDMGDDASFGDVIRHLSEAWHHMSAREREWYDCGAK